MLKNRGVIFIYKTVMLLLMEQTIIYISLILSGLCLGSFAGATVWRLRARQLQQDKKSGDKVDGAESKRLSKLTKYNLLNDRSQCLDCSYKLKWYDLMPLVSWLLLLGRCRSCKKPIGIMEPLIELGVATFFVLSYMFWPFGLSGGLEIARFVIWLVAGVSLAVLFAYDKKWFLLPNMANFTLIGLGAISAILVIIGAGDKMGTIYNILGSVLVLSGIYYILYFISKGKWIGFGDIKLGLGLALLIADWQLSFVALFAANLIGCLIVLPFMIAGKLKRGSHVPFGPLLIIGSFVAVVAGGYLINAYFYGLL